MSFKTSGKKTKYKDYYTEKEYTVYAALESCSDVFVVTCKDNKGIFIDLYAGTEDDCAKGCHSVIDVLYFLKYYDIGTYHFGNSNTDDIVIEKMTEEDMNDVFHNKNYINVQTNTKETLYETSCDDSNVDYSKYSSI